MLQCSTSVLVGGQHTRCPTLVCCWVLLLSLLTAVSAAKLHGRGGIVHLALQSIGQRPKDRHVILVTHEDSGVSVWNFRYSLGQGTM